MFFGGQRKVNWEHKYSVAEERIEEVECRLASVHRELCNSRRQRKSHEDNALELQRKASRLIDDNDTLTDRCARADKELDSILARQVDMQMANTSEADNHRLQLINNRKTTEISNLRAELNAEKIKFTDEFLRRKEADKKLKEILEFPPEGELKLCQERVTFQSELKDGARKVCGKLRSELTEEIKLRRAVENALREARNYPFSADHQREIHSLRGRVTGLRRDVTKYDEVVNALRATIDKKLKELCCANEVRDRIGLDLILAGKKNKELSNRNADLVQSVKYLSEDCAANKGKADAHKDDAVSKSRENVSLRATIASIGIDRDSLARQIDAQEGTITNLTNDYLELNKRCEELVAAVKSDRSTIYIDSSVIKTIELRPSEDVYTGIPGPEGAR